MTEHTPGPWRIQPTSMKGQFLVAGGDLREGDGFSLQFSEGNARLIAAAPDLLKLAKLLERSLVYEIKKSDREGDEEGARLKFFTLAEVREVIAKAEGDETTITLQHRATEQGG